MENETAKNYKVVRSEALSTRYESRYIVVDSESGKVLDNAQGYGYKSPQKAHAGYAYQHRSKEQIENAKKQKAKVRKFCSKNKGFVRELEQCAFEIAKGSWGPEDKFNVALVKQLFKDNGYDLKELGFTASEFLRYW